jgi:hypothetical protein
MGCVEPHWTKFDQQFSKLKKEKKKYLMFLTNRKIVIQYKITKKPQMSTHIEQEMKPYKPFKQTHTLEPLESCKTKS